MKTNFKTDFFRKELEFMRHSDRTAGRIEFFDSSEVREAEKNAMKYFRYVSVQKNSSGGTDLFYSERKKPFNLLIRHTRLVEKGDIASIRVTGEILGYPSCCIDAYIKDRLYLTVDTGLNWFIRRAEAGDKINPFINPFESDIRFVPCRLGCKDTYRIVRQMKKIFRSDARHSSETAYLTPVPFRTETAKSLCIRDFARIRIKKTEKNIIRYSFIDKSPSMDISSVEEGDTLIFANGIISVFAGGKSLGRLVMSHLLWSPLVLPDRGFCNELLKAIRNYRFIASPDEDSQSYVPDTGYQKLFEKVKKVVNRFPQGGPVGFNSPQLAGNMVRTAVYVKGIRYNIVLQYNKDARNYFLRGRNISLCIEGRSSNITAALTKILQIFLNLID